MSKQEYCKNWTDRVTEQSVLERIEASLGANAMENIAGLATGDLLEVDGRYFGYQRVNWASILPGLCPLSKRDIEFPKCLCDICFYMSIKLGGFWQAEEIKSERMNNEEIG